jgi:hypothetical protein
MDITEAIQRQRIWLDLLQGISGKPILIKAKEGKTQDENYDEYKWIPYTEEWKNIKQPIYTRGILLNEVCFDPDVKDWNILKTEMQKIASYCQKENIPLYLAYSGGNGIHGHIFFDPNIIDPDNLEDAKKYDIDLPKIVRNVILDLILDEAGTNRMILQLDPKKVNFSVKRKGSQVREFGTTRPDGHYKTLITTIPNTKEEAQRLPLIFPEKVVLWTLPKKYNIAVNKKLREAITEAAKYNEFDADNLDLAGYEIKNFPCITTLMKNGTVDGKRYYASNNISIISKKCGCSWKVTKENILKLFKNCDISEDEIKLRVDNNKPLYDQGYGFSCKVMKETFGQGICDFQKCAIDERINFITSTAETKPLEPEAPQHIKDDANKKLDEGKAIEFLITTCNKFHVGDETTKKATLGAISTQSIINSNGIQPKVSGGSGKGKSHAIKSVFHLVPPEYIEETSLSGKALFHANVRPGTIIFSDDEETDEAIQNVIKRSTTNFQSKTKHKISVKDGNEWTTKDLVIPERIIWALTSVNDNGSLEYINRQFNLGVDESSNQDDAVWNLLTDKAVLAEVDLNITDDVLICREIIRDIKKHLFAVRIPYAKRIVFNDKQNRRNGAQFLDFIKAFAVFNYRLRVKVNDSTIEANEQDFKDAVSLYGQRAPNQKLKLNDTEIAVLKLMGMNEPHTIEKLQEITKKSRSSLYYMIHGRNGSGGLLEKVPGLMYLPETEFSGTSEIVGHDEFEKEYTTVKKTKPRHVYVLTVDFNSLLNFGAIATLEPEVKT